MKKLVSIILLCLSFITTLTAQSYWKQIGMQGILLGVGPDGNLYSYYGSNYGPSIIRSQDEGQTWEIVLGYETGFDHYLNEHCFTISPEGRIFVFAYDIPNQVFYSDDNGDTWQQGSEMFGLEETTVMGLYAASNDIIAGWTADNEVFLTVNGFESYSYPYHLDVITGEDQYITDLIINDNKDIYIAIYRSIGTDIGVYHINIFDMLSWGWAAFENVGIQDLEFDPEGNVVCGVNFGGEFPEFGQEPGFYAFWANSLGIANNGIVYRWNNLDKNYAVLAYSYDHGETFTEIGEDLPLAPLVPGSDDGFLFKGADNYLYFRGHDYYWKSRCNADEIPTYNPWIGARFFDENSGLFYIVTGANSVEVSRVKTENLEPYSYEGDITIPEIVDFEGRTYTVTGIGEGAFSACQMLTSVAVPSTVTYVEYRAFYYCPSLQSVVLSDNIAEMGREVFRYCEQLTSVNIPQAMTYLPDYLFGECSSLSAMEIPETITHIGDYAFANTALTSAVIPNTVKTIGNGAFSSCKDLEMVQLPESLECINGYLFNGCEKLRSVNIPTTVRTIEACAFRNCIIEGDLILHDGLFKIGGSAFESCNHITKVTIPNTVTSIERCAFMGCSSLTSVALPDGLDTIARALFSSCLSLPSISIPESIVSIGEYAFYRCDSLKQVFVSRHVSDIGKEAFAECCSLKSIDVDHDNAYYKSVDGVLFNAPKTILMQYPAGKEDESYQVPGSVTVLDRSSFAGAAHLQHVDVPNSVSVIGQHAFYRCSGLRSFVVPNNVTAIHPWTFSECLELQTVTMGSSVEIIDEDAFYRCQQLSLVLLGSSVRSIGQGAFETYSALNPEEPAKLTLVCCRTTPVSYYEYATPCQEALIVPCGLESDYAAVWPYWNGDIIGDCKSYQIDVTGNMGGNQINLSTTSAKLGDEVQYSVALESGYMLESIEVYKIDNETIRIPVKDNKFVMPNFDVVLKAHFLPLSLEDPGAEWYYEILNENGSVTYQYLMQAGDTLVNNEEPHIIIRINTLYDKEEHIEKTHEYIFERDHVVYWWNKTLGEFTVLYDFGAEAGDEWEIKVGTTSLVMHVDAVEQYEYEGRIFKMLHVSDASDLFSGTIVCGIGHLTSFFPERLMNGSKGYRVEGIRCFWKDEQLLFKFGEKDCDEVYEEYHYDIDEPITADGFLVYPNPCDGILTIAGVQASEYRITNLLGQNLKTGRINTENQQINVAALPTGVYFINIDGKTTKFVKH